MTRIKICGITNPEDARAAIELGADALGFIAVPESPRYLDPCDYAFFWDHPALCDVPFVSRVIVVRAFKDALDYNPAHTWVQYYEGLHNVERSIRVVRLRDESSLNELYRMQNGIGPILLDAYHESALGGAGRTFDWSLAVEAKRRTNRPILLAGGLTPENVGDAIAAVRPYAVDVSSGVEAEPGRKDYAKLRAFFRAVRAADCLLDESRDSRHTIHDS